MGRPDGAADRCVLHAAPRPATVTAATGTGPRRPPPGPCPSCRHQAEGGSSLGRSAATDCNRCGL
ncbi:hypothetical protein T261_02071 [Streptomyces lydicus]|nr:hypothetical protein T261_02071 [Streptomyces lydicus]